MRIKFARAVTAAVAAGVLGVAALAILVAVLGPGGSFAESMPFAQRLGAWVGPISGFVFCLLGGWWTAKPTAQGDKLLNGFAMGTAGAVLDIAISLSSGAGWAALLLISNAGRIIGGTIGGWIAAKRTA